MKRAPLDRRLVAAVRAAASGPLLVAFDFDGTLAPIHADIGGAELRPETRTLLSRVAEQYPTAVLTGRSRRDAAGRLRGVPLAALIGNHGLETAVRHARARAAVRRWMTTLPARLRGVAGIEVENKGETLAIHYRRAHRPAVARRRILRAAAELSPRPRIVGGKALVNLVPDEGLDKGTALAALMRRHAARALYVGDDDTDEAVFGLPRALRVVTVRVGRARRSRARYRLASQRSVDLLLRELVDCRDR